MPRAKVEIPVAMKPDAMPRVSMSSLTNILIVAPLAMVFASAPGVAAQAQGRAAQFKAQMLASAMLAGDWLVNNQEKRQDSKQPHSGDYGRWLYEYKIPQQNWRGSTSWTAATGIMGLALLHERTGIARYKEAVTRAGLYLVSLQILDARNRRNYGAIREHTPLSDFSFPRDGATGLGGLLALYRFTGDMEYLERARIFADWYLREAFNPATQWPYYTFPFDVSKVDASDHRAGAWQAGSGIFLYQLYKATKDRTYFDKGVIRFAEGLVKNAREKTGLLNASIEAADRGFDNNDDFATLTVLAAYRETGDKRYWDLVMERLKLLMNMQREDGAIVPGNTGGMYISMITALDALALAVEKNAPIEKERLERFVRRAAEFALTLQETRPDEMKSFGGFYGQTNLENFRREWIHARGTTYSMIFNLRYEGGVRVPYYSVFGWD
jgi:hypothetical protein